MTLVSDKAKILVMDDEEMIRTVAQKMLEFLGYSVMVVKNGEEAIVAYLNQQASGRAFDGIILDWTVQYGMNGPQTLAALLQINPTVKCLLSSGMDPVEAVKKATSMGFFGTINKPYDIKGMAATLKAMLA